MQKMIYYVMPSEGLRRRGMTGILSLVSLESLGHTSLPKARSFATNVPLRTLTLHIFFSEMRIVTFTDHKIVPLSNK